MYENYGQPNHIYFQYHGFILEENTHDCSSFTATIDPPTDQKDITKLQEKLRQNQFYSYSQTFCVGDLEEKESVEELEKMGRFLRIRAGEDNDDNIKNGLLKDGAKIVAGFMEELAGRYGDLDKLEKDVKGNYSKQCMVNIAKAERDKALSVLKLLKNGKLSTEPEL